MNWLQHQWGHRSAGWTYVNFHEFSTLDSYVIECHWAIAGEQLSRMRCHEIPQRWGIRTDLTKAVAWVRRLPSGRGVWHADLKHLDFSLGCSKSTPSVWRDVFWVMSQAYQTSVLYSVNCYTNIVSVLVCIGHVFAVGSFTGPQTRHFCYMSS